MASRPRFVIDTNVLVSALLTPMGTSRQAVSRANRFGFIVQSRETFEETERVLSRDRFDKYLTSAERARFLRALATKSIFVEVNQTITACSDPDDDKFLELAVGGGAIAIVTGNKKDFPRADEGKARRTTCR